MRHLRIALEEQSDGVARREKEHVFYARIPNFEILKEANSSEFQEQWEIKLPKTDKNAAEGKARVRMTVTEGGQPDFVLTFKTKASAQNGDNIETAVQVTEDLFKQFRMMAEAGMRKQRFTYQVDGSDLKWEVDMFYKPGAQPGSNDFWDWAKIDLEVMDMEAPLPPLPSGFVDLITKPYGQRTEAEEARVSSLYKNEFVLPNPHLQG